MVEWQLGDSDGLDGSLLQFLIVAWNLDRQVVELLDEENNRQFNEHVQNLFQFWAIDGHLHLFRTAFNLQQVDNAFGAVRVRAAAH